MRTLIDTLNEVFHNDDFVFDSVPSEDKVHHAISSLQEYVFNKFQIISFNTKFNHNYILTSKKLLIPFSFILIKIHIIKYQPKQLPHHGVITTLLQRYHNIITAYHNVITTLSHHNNVIN